MNDLNNINTAIASFNSNDFLKAIFYGNKSFKVLGESPDGQFPEGLFPDWQFSEDISQTDSSPTDSSLNDSSPNHTFFIYLYLFYCWYTNVAEANEFQQKTINTSNKLNAVVKLTYL